MLNNSQLANTRKYIGGSRAAAILGLSSFQTPQDVYNEIMFMQDAEQQTSERMHFGNIIEDVIRKELALRLNVEIEIVENTMVHPKHEFLIGHPDGLIKGRKEGIEIKNRSIFMKKFYGDEDTDEALPSDIAQVQHYMNVLGYEKFYLGVFFGGQELRIYEIQRDDNFIEKMERKLVHFWNEHILKQVPPPPLSTKEINAEWAGIDEKAIDANLDIILAHDELLQVKSQISTLEKQKEKLENDIKLYMKDSTILSDGTNKLATWRTQSRTDFDSKKFKEEHAILYEQYTKKSEFRVLRFNGKGK